jgi:replication initiation protein RepC
MLAAHTTAEQFDGTEATSPGQILAAFKAAAPYLGLRPTIVHAVDWLFQFTQPQDWQSGARPIVWPSAALQREALSLGPSQAKTLNRTLAELRLVVMRDSPNGKRYGRRDPKGRIVEAYGFDLSPLGERWAEFQAVAEAGRAERAEQQALRRRATIARNGLRQIMETAAEAAIGGLDWQTWQTEAAKASRGLARLPSLALMAEAVAILEQVQKAAREGLETALIRRQAERAGPVDTDPKGPENRPHITSTNQLTNPPDTVMASNECKPGPTGDARDRPTRQDRGTVLRVTPEDVVKLAPKLRAYLQRPSPTWPELVDAADWLRHDLGISKPLWGEACVTMGREQAAIAVAIVSAKPAEHFRTSPGGYYRGMVNKARAGELNLARTVWGIRATGENRTPRHLCT